MGLKTTNKEFTIVIDPLDGSTIFIQICLIMVLLLLLQKIINARIGLNLVTGIITYRVF